jgi:hypothetical protein
MEEVIAAESRSEHNADGGIHLPPQSVDILEAIVASLQPILGEESRYLDHQLVPLFAAALKQTLRL